MFLLSVCFIGHNSILIYTREPKKVGKSFRISEKKVFQDAAGNFRLHRSEVGTCRGGFPRMAFLRRTSLLMVTDVYASIRNTLF